MKNHRITTLIAVVVCVICVLCTLYSFHVGGAGRVRFN